jgi:Zn-finger domain-containing protein
MKWLNIIMDLNGILFVCIEERLMRRGQTYVIGTKPYSSVVPYLVRPKAIYVCPASRRILRELSNMADIIIKSSMRVATVKSVCELLFVDLPVKPINILEQESCDKIKVHDDHGHVSYLKVKRINKPLFLKSLGKRIPSRM